MKKLFSFIQSLHIYKKRMSSENTEYFRTKAFIFDLDGTLIDTTPLVERHWHRFADENGLDGNKASIYIYLGKKKKVFLS